MYNSFFGFKDKPFNVTPDPRFYYANRSYQEAYASLLYGIQERKGFIVLTGEVGVGKTTLLRRLIGNLGENVHFSFLYNTNLSFDDLLGDVCEDLGLNTSKLNRVEKIKLLNAFLIERLKAGETVALLIDEAQNLRVDVMEELRVLSNLETANEKLLQIILVGQPELEEKLNRQDLRQLKQRIAIRCRLKPLEPSEVGDFIHSRLATVGYQGPELFVPDAIRQIAGDSGGLPRLINNICDNSLLIAFASEQHAVTVDMVEEVARDLELGDAQSAERRVQSAERRDQGVGEVESVEPRDQSAQPHRVVAVDGQQSTWRIGRFLLAASVLLFVGVGTVYVANPYEIRERLALRGFSVDRVEGVIQYLEQKLNSVLNSARG